MISSIYRFLPDFKGKQRLGRLLFKERIRKARDVLVNGKYNIKYCVPNLKECIGYEIFINGIYEQETSDFIISRIPDGGIYIDIGANIGSIAIPVCLNKKNVNAICIEASHSVFKYLKENVRLNNLDNIVLVNQAISDKDGDEVGFYNPADQFGKGYISHDKEKQLETVTTICLDSLLKNKNILNIDFIKVDIEGYEYYAFKGAKKILEIPTAPDIFFEFEDWAEGRAIGLKPGDAQAFLFQNGYKLFIINKGQLHKIDSPKLNGSAMIWATKKNKI